MSWSRPNPYANQTALKQPMNMRWRDEDGTLLPAGKYKTIKGKNVLIRRLEDNQILGEGILQPEFFISWLVENNLHFLVLVNSGKKYYTKVTDWDKRATITDDGKAYLENKYVKIK